MKSDEAILTRDHAPMTHEERISTLLAELSAAAREHESRHRGAKTQCEAAEALGMHVAYASALSMAREIFGAQEELW